MSDVWPTVHRHFRPSYDCVCVCFALTHYAARWSFFIFLFTHLFWNLFVRVEWFSGQRTGVARATCNTWLSSNRLQSTGNLTWDVARRSHHALERVRSQSKARKSGAYISFARAHAQTRERAASWKKLRYSSIEALNQHLRFFVCFCARVKLAPSAFMRNSHHCAAIKSTIDM